MFRIQRDTRFSKEKTPYKTWIGLRFFHERFKETDTPVFYAHIARGDCFVGAGVWHPQAPALKRIREYMLSNPRSWEKMTRDPAFTKKFRVGGSALVRPPRGFDPEHALIEDLKRKDFVFSTKLKDAAVTDPNFLQQCHQHYDELSAIVDWLCGALELEF